MTCIEEERVCRKASSYFEIEITTLTITITSFIPGCAKMSEFRGKLIGRQKRVALHCINYGLKQTHFVFAQLLCVCQLHNASLFEAF